MVEAAVALLAEGVDRNFIVQFRSLSSYVSPSSRRAWIEIVVPGALGAGVSVALLAEGVDRNTLAEYRDLLGLKVALLAEGVDRNLAAVDLSPMLAVALLAEGVDRN